MLWKDALYDGAVIKVHPSGAVDATFDVNGNVGRSLTKAENILELLGEDGKKKEKPAVVGGKKRKRKVCSANGCFNQSEVRGLCRKHGGKPCSIEGCATKAAARGLHTSLYL